MNALRDVLNDCNITYHDVPSKLPVNESKLTEFRSIFQGLSVDFAHMTMTADYTYQSEFLSIKIVFYNNVTYNDARELADIIAKSFNILNPPQLKVKETPINTKVPQNIEFVIRYENKYKIAMFLIHLMNTCDADNKSIL
jgi:hypothetical protein